MSIVKISNFYDKTLEDAKALVAANLRKGWRISFYTGWGAHIENPEGEEIRHDMSCPKSVLDLADFADRVLELGGGDNTWVTGTKEPRKTKVKAGAR